MKSREMDWAAAEVWKVYFLQQSEIKLSASLKSLWSDSSCSSQAIGKSRFMFLYVTYQRQHQPSVNPNQPSGV